MRIRQSLLQPYHTCPRQGSKSPGRCSYRELEFRDCGAIPGQGPLVTAERQTEGMWGRRLWWEVPVEEIQAAMEARPYCWVMPRGMNHHHSLSLPTGQHWQLNNREAGPSSAWHMNDWVEPHLGRPFKCLTRCSTDKDPSQGGSSAYLMPRATEKDPRQGSPLSAWMGAAMEKDWPERPSDRQLQEAQNRLW